MSNNTYGFRTALSGFHKGDVTGYVEKMASQHRSELLEYEKLVTSLREENRALQQQLNLLMMSTPLVQEAAPAPAPAPVIAPPPVQEAEPLPVSAPAEDQDLMHLELLAYRRAESVERNANQRAKKLYQQMGNLCEDALDDFQSTDAALKQAVQAILSQIDTLEQSYRKLSDALQESKEELASTNGLLSIESEE